MSLVRIQVVPHQKTSGLSSACFISDLSNMKAALDSIPNIHIDPLFKSLRAWLDDHSPTSVAVVTDPMTEKWCLPALNPHLPPGTQFLRLGQHGEKIKSIEHTHALWDSFEGMGMDRHGLVIALGGGTITDLTAFASSTYLRGVHFWLIPTTLLSMVDASIGGKTGINFRGLKNRIGTFAQPSGVSIHSSFLDTLDAREMANGWAEHIKHTLIASKEARELPWENTLKSAQPEAFEGAIIESIAIKSNIVDQDALETNGTRKTLNFGHTSGHALESWAMEQSADLKHGEAVAWGMRIALKMSEFHAECPQVKPGEFDGVSRSLATLIPLPCGIPDAEVLWNIMGHDKKNQGEQVKVVLLNGPGCPKVDVNVTLEDFQQALSQLPSS